MKRSGTVISAIAALIVLTACGEKPQTAKTGSNDVAPFQGATNGFVAAGWKPGDKTSWEQSLKARANNTQNEYSKAR